jgi:leucyl aminopeptidase
LGDEKKIDVLGYERAAGAAAALANKEGAKVIRFLADGGLGKVEKGEAEAHAAYGALLRTYDFDKYRTTLKADQKPTLKNIESVGAKTAAGKVFKPLAALLEGTYFTRDLVTEPANVVYPESFMKQCKELTKLGVKVTALSQTQMEKLGMGALLGVAQGSVKAPYLVVMEWNGAAKSQKPVAFIGKGVTFDTGGISIKPANGMEDMKFDMAGAGTVAGLMKTLATRNAKVNAIGAIGLVENMPDGNAQRPGDVVTSMSGQTIEVLNTDAEGRLVLADVLWYVQDKYKPKFMINLATLTGAILVALGTARTGLFSNSDELCEKLEGLQETTGEKLWRLPLGEEYDKQINSDIADMQNIGGRYAGSITAGQFLQRFVNDTPWAHLDIAGTEWTKEDLPTIPKGSTAWGVRMLDALVKEHYEK